MNAPADRTLSAGAGRTAGMAQPDLHVAWTSFQRRQVSMAPVCGFEAVFLPLDKSLGRWGKVLAYLRLTAQTARLLWTRQPRVVWVQLPQVPLLWVALAYRALRAGSVRVVADCHNAQLRPPWSSFPLARWALRRADAVLVHNADMARQAAALGWPMERVLVMEDVPPTGVNGVPLGLAKQHVHVPRPWVVFPGSFSADEPIGELLQAARLAPELSFIVTGRTQNAARHRHDLSALPPNVLTPGFLTVDVFDDLLREADCVLALTREEGIQLSVCNEALGFAKPLVASDTRLLGELFSRAAVMVDSSDPAAIAQGCRKALGDSAQRAALSGQLAQARLASWQSGPLAELHRLLACRDGLRHAR